MFELFQDVVCTIMSSTGVRCCKACRERH